MRARIILTLLVALAGVSDLTGGPPEATAKQPFEVRDTAGRVWRGDALKGKFTLIYFWATWCNLCKAALPELERLEKAYGPGGLEILGVSADTAGRAEVTAYLNRNRVRWPQVHDGRGMDGEAVRFFGVTQLPAYVLLDGHGNLLAQDLETATRKLSTTDSTPMAKRGSDEGSAIPQVFPDAGGRILVSPITGTRAYACPQDVQAAPPVLVETPGRGRHLRSARSFRHGPPAFARGVHPPHISPHDFIPVFLGCS